MATEPFRLTAVQALQAFNSDSLTVEQYAESLLGRIKERDPIVKAWAHIDPSQVLQQAKALDKVPKDQRGPLHGVAVAIKDVIYTKGMCYMSCCRQLELTCVPRRHAYSTQFSDLQRRPTRSRRRQRDDASTSRSSDLGQDHHDRVRFYDRWYQNFECTRSYSDSWRLLVWFWSSCC